MWHSVSPTAIKKMRDELALWEYKANEEIRDPKSRALGELRMYLVEECQRSLWYIERVMRTKRSKARSS
jgi:hypothetical protein